MSLKGTSALVLSAIIIAGLGSAPAAGRQRTVTVTATNNDLVARQVSYRDLNLASADGERKLIRRVHSAVHNVCLEVVGGDRGYMQQTATCRRSSWQGAEPQIGEAVKRARDIAATGWSAIAPVAITISVGSGG